ncbi:MAG TPA: hypothetical protein VIG44_08860 [Thermomicrobiales bacterium]|jgi:uncharacterized protein YycO
MTYHAGDLLLVEGDGGVQDRLIALGTRSRYVHCALIADAAGGILEAVNGGIRAANASRYARTRLVDVGLADEERADMLTWAQTQVGDAYSYLEIASITLARITGGHLYLNSGRAFTCSAFCARALEQGGVLLPEACELISPGDLDRLYPEAA